MKKFVRKINMKLFFLGVLVISVVVVSLGIFKSSYALTEPIPNVSFSSQILDYSQKVKGSIHVEENAKWIAKNKARVTFDVDTVSNNAQTMDTILVLDVSESMDGKQLDQVKQDTKKMIRELLTNSENKVALISFDSEARVISNFTNNIDELMSGIDTLSSQGQTNYYQALANVDTLLSDYKKEPNKDCIVLFLTDGYPSLEIPNEKNEYIYLKNMYPYLTINAIQFEMGSDILEPIKDISDNQFSANMDTLYDLLLEAYTSSDSYEKFIIQNTIDTDYFEITSASSIHSSIGQAELIEENGEQKIIWTIPKISSGAKATLTIDMNLNRHYVDKKGFFPTSKEVSLNYKIGEVEEELIDNQTTVLQTYYKISYDKNTPEGCTVQNLPSATRKIVYDSVEINTVEPSCGDYQFLGWKIVTDNTNQIGDDYFVMPEHDVVLRAEWGKVTIKVSMDGQVYIEKPDNSKTAQEAVNEMKIGWNLGNTLDSCNYQKKYLGEEKAVNYYETLWHNPTTTMEMIEEVKKAGFNSIRVPVTYYDHIDEDGKIDRYWLERVKEVVQYVLDNDMYCILDVHHDSGYYEGGSWIVADSDKYQENADKLEALWTQIATEFRDFDYKLIFEGFNEILDSEKNTNWKESNEDTLNVNKLNQVFVDTVRKTGGRNTDRFLAVTTYGGATYQHLLENFVLPKDEADNKIILAMHNYNYTESDIDTMIANIKTYCIDKGIPVMLDEFGTKEEEVEKEERVSSAAYYVSSARKIGVTCFWWDSGKATHSRIFNRENLIWEQSEIKDALISNS